MAFEKELETGRAAAARAGEVALRYQSKGLTAEAKPDLSPVTEADRECERLLSQILAEAFPQDGLLGEEGAVRKSASGRRWIVDPIDGTRDYLRGTPSWAVLLALEDGNDIDVGVCHFPTQQRTYFAVKGGGAFCNDRSIHVSAITDPAQAMLCVNSFNEILRYPFAPRLLEWMKRFWAVRSLGGCQDAMLVADGRAEAWIEPGGEAWDFAALKIIAEEAGAVFFNFDGRSTIYGGNCAICVPALEVELRRFVIGTEKKEEPQSRPPLGPGQPV